MGKTISSASPTVAVDYSATLITSVETSSKSWVVAAHMPGLGHIKAKQRIDPTAAALATSIEGCRRPAAASGRVIDRVIVVYDAGQFRGVPRRGIYDNMRTAVDRVGRGKERQVNARFSAMVSHHLFDTEFCNPAAGWEKGQVEKNVQDVCPRLWLTMPRFPTRDAPNDWLEQRCIELWSETPHGGQPGTIADAWEGEMASMMPLSRPFDGFVEYSKRVSPTCLVHLERYRYSVRLATNAGRKSAAHLACADHFAC